MFSRITNPTARASDAGIVWHAQGLRTRYRPEIRLCRGLVATAPWSNLALLVIFYLLLTAPYVLQPGVVVNLPQAPFVDGRAYGHRLALLSQESVEPGAREEIVFFDDERFLVKEPRQMAALKSALLKAVKAKPQSSLIIEADRRVLHGTIVDIFNMAADAGVKEINIATRPVR